MATEETARFYTRSRRFPKLIGRMTDGSRIPGGPYTMTQVFSGGAVFIGALVFRSVWTTDSWILDVIYTALLTGLVIWLVGFIPTTNRNLIAVFMDAVAAMFKPAAGKYDGKVPQIRRPHQVAGEVVVLAVTPSPASEAAAAPVATPVPARSTAIPALVEARGELVAAGPTRRVPVSAVEQLLQQAQRVKEKN